MPSAPEPKSREIPSRLQALRLWLMSVVVVVAIGFAIGVVATLIALRSGLPFERALSLITDPHASPLVTSSTWIASSIAANEFGVLATMLIWLRRHPVAYELTFPIGKPSWRGFVGAIGVAFGFAPLAEFAGELVNRALPRELTSETMILTMAHGAQGGELFGVLIAAALMPALVEEAMFRGLVTRAFEKRSHAEMVLVPSLLFGLFHLEPNQVAGTIVLGVAFGLGRLYTGSILPCIVAHAVYNAEIVLDLHFSGHIGDHALHFGRVGAGLGVAALATLLMMSAPGHGLPQRRSFLPPPR